jgi:hypothetical protein
MLSCSVARLFSPPYITNGQTGGWKLMIWESIDATLRQDKTKERFQEN